MLLSILGRIDRAVLNLTQRISDVFDSYLGFTHWTLARRCLDIGLAGGLVSVGLLYQTNNHLPVFFKIILSLLTIVFWCYRDRRYRLILAMQQQSRHGSRSLQLLEQSERCMQILVVVFSTVVFILPPLTGSGIIGAFSFWAFALHYYFKAATTPQNGNFIRPAYQT